MTYYALYNFWEYPCNQYTTAKIVINLFILQINFKMFFVRRRGLLVIIIPSYLKYPTMLSTQTKNVGVSVYIHINTYTYTYTYRHTYFVRNYKSHCPRVVAWHWVLVFRGCSRTSYMTDYEYQQQ